MSLIFLQLPRQLSVGVLHFSTASSVTTKSQQLPVTEPVTGQQQDGDYEAYTMPHPVWTEEEMHSVQITHTPPEKAVDTVLLICVRVCHSIVFPTPCTAT